MGHLKATQRLKARPVVEADQDSPGLQAVQSARRGEGLHCVPAPTAFFTASMKTPINSSPPHSPRFLLLLLFVSFPWVHPRGLSPLCVLLGAWAPKSREGRMRRDGGREEGKGGEPLSAEGADKGPVVLIK